MNSIKAKDILTGFESERFMLLYVQVCTLDFTLDYSTDKWSPFDYYSKDKSVCVELKTRKCKSSTYPTTMIPLSKIRKCDDPNKQYWFFFRFNDKVNKYIKYNKELFDTFERKVGGRKDRGRYEYNDYLFIPVDKCTTLIA